MLINSIKLWRVGITKKFISCVLMELVICSIHNIPGDMSFKWKIVPYYSAVPIVSEIPIDVFLSMPMFFRYYLIWRVYVLNTKILSSKFCTMGVINSIKLNSKFTLKTVMEYYPLQLLIVSNVLIIMSAAWCMRFIEGYRYKMSDYKIFIKHFLSNLIY